MKKGLLISNDLISGKNNEPNTPNILVCHLFSGTYQNLHTQKKKNI